MQYIEGLRAIPGGSRTRIYLLGLTPLPGWTKVHGTQQVEPRIFRSINHALGMRCHRRAAAPPAGGGGGASGDVAAPFGLSSRHGITPIDRFATVGLRRRDMIHPFFNAQFAIVQMMLNHLCPAGGADADAGSRRARSRRHRRRRQ